MTNNMRNIFLVRGSEKTMVQFRKTGSVAESAASHLSTKTNQTTLQNNVIMQKKEKHRRPSENIY